MNPRFRPCAPLHGATRARAALMIGALAAALAWPAARARADECRVDENCEVRVESLDYSGSWEWSVDAEFALDGRLDSARQRENDATATVGGSLSYDGKTCRWVGADGEIGGYWDGQETGLTGTAEFTFCLPYPVFRPETRILFEQDLRPRLSAPPTVRASRVRGAEIHMLVNTIHMSATKDEVTTHMRFLVFGGGFGLVAQDVADMPARTDSMYFEFDIIRGVEYGNGFLGQDRELRVLRFAGDFKESDDAAASGAGRGVMAVDVLIFETKSSRLFKTGLWADMALGLGVGDMPDVQVLSPHLEFTLMGGTAARSFGVGYTRQVEGTSYEAVLMEDRLSGWWRQASDRNATTSHAFLALTEIVDAAGQSERTLTGGVGIDHEMVVGEYLRLSVGAELARSYYATMHGDAPLDAAWVGQVSVSAGAFESSR